MSLSFLTLTLPFVLDTTNSKEPLSYRDSVIDPVLKDEASAKLCESFCGINKGCFLTKV